MAEVQHNTVPFPFFHDSEHFRISFRMPNVRLPVPTINLHVFNQLTSLLALKHFVSMLYLHFTTDTPPEYDSDLHTDRPTLHNGDLIHTPHYIPFLSTPTLRQFTSTYRAYHNNNHEIFLLWSVAYNRNNLKWVIDMITRYVTFYFPETTTPYRPIGVVLSQPPRHYIFPQPNTPYHPLLTVVATTRIPATHPQVPTPLVILPQSPTIHIRPTPPQTPENYPDNIFAEWFHEIHPGQLDL